MNSETVNDNDDELGLYTACVKCGGREWDWFACESRHSS